MSVRSAARYVFGILWVRLMALNDDLTIPTTDRIIGGAGPFDFSGVDDVSAVPMSFKIDAGAVETITVDLSGVVDDSAVTAAELFAAINTESPTDIIASLEAVTLRLQIAYSGTETVGVIQVYGKCAEIALIGQGFGNQFVNIQTMKSMNTSPISKDEERITNTDAQGQDVEVLTDGYRKGFSMQMVDVAIDLRCLKLIEGGTIDDTTGEYEDPTSNSPKIYFYIEAFYGKYTQGENKEADMIGVERRFYQSCKGSEGDSNIERNWRDGNFTITGTSYKDENEVLHGASKNLPLTIEEWEAYDVENVAI